MRQRWRISTKRDAAEPARPRALQHFMSAIADASFFLRRYDGSGRWATADSIRQRPNHFASSRIALRRRLAFDGRIRRSAKRCVENTAEARTLPHGDAIVNGSHSGLSPRCLDVYVGGSPASRSPRMTTRRLAAILAADVVGFSSMMEKDEEGTLRACQGASAGGHRAEGAGARWSAGEDDRGRLSRASSAARSRRCAAPWRSRRRTKANGGSDLLLRMGINLGDIIVEPDGDIYGDGVNVAARLEQLAEPGGVCISGSVHEHARRQGRPVQFESRGEQQVKNIARPVRVYALAGARSRR